MVDFFRKIIPEDYFSFHGIFLKVLGLCPPENKKLIFLYWVVALPHFLLIGPCAIIFEITSVVISDDNYSRKVLNFGMSCMHMASLVKHITWFIIRNEFDSVISIIKRPTFDFKIFGYPGLEAFQNGDKLTKPDHDTSPGTELQHIDSIASYQKRIKYETDRFCTIWYCSYMLYLIVNIASSYTINFFQSTIEEFNPRINRTSTYRDFVYPMWLPFDVSISDGYYLIAFFYQPYAVFFLMGGFITLDCLLLNTITQLKSQVKVISFALEHVDDNIPQAIDATKKNEEIRVVKCIQELQKIFRAAEKLDGLLNVSFLIHSGLVLFVLCCCSFYGTKLSHAFQVLHIISMTTAVLLEVFAVNWFCQDFSLEFSNVLEAMYGLDWLNYPPRLRKTIIVTMARLQKPPCFTMGNWAKLDMLSFSNMLKFVYSFYTLISNVNK